MRRRIAGRGAAALVAAGLAAAVVTGCSAKTSAAPARTTPRPPPPTLTPTPTPTQTPTPIATSSAPGSKLEHVRPSKPAEFVMHGPAFTIKAHVCAMPFVRPLDPPGEQHHTVCWVDSHLGEHFGVAPGSPSSGTSYLLGHAWAEDSQEVLNPMSERAMRQVHLSHPHYVDKVPVYPVTNLDGYTVTLRTHTGRLTYKITRTFAVNKARAADVHSVMAQRTANRLVLITCGVRDGRDVDVNVISYAKLVRAVALPA